MEFKGNEPIYLQIYHYYQRLIEKGVLAPGTHLPSVRDFAIAHQINPNTVQRSFAMLTADGYLKSIEKKGFYVRPVSKENKRSYELSLALDNLLNEGFSVDEIIACLKEKEKKLYD